MTKNSPTPKKKKQNKKKKLVLQQPIPNRLQVVVAPKPKERRKKRPENSERLKPGGRFNAAIARTIARDGGSWDRNTKAVKSLIVSGEDRFHAGLLGSLLDPSRPFPLPSPGSSPFSSISQTYGLTFDMYGTGATPNNANPFFSTEARGSTRPQYTSAGAMLGRYSRYSGRVVGTLETTTNASGQLEVWFFHDPTSLDFPVVAIVPSVTGNYLGMTRLQNYTWTSNPYPFEKLYENENGSNPGTRLEQLNTYYEGGSLLHVHTLNPNAYLSVSYQTRTGDNTYDRFIDTVPELWSTADPGSALYLSDTPETATGAISMYTGMTWHMGSAFAIADSEDGARFSTSEYFRRVWAYGGPFVRALVRTTNGSGGAAGPVQFSVNLLTWNATAPNSPGVASSMPLETVPVEMPTWARALRTRGMIYKGPINNLADKLWSRQLEKIPQTIVPNTPMTRAIISNPSAVLPTVVQHPVLENHAKNNWIDTLRGVASIAAPSVGSWIANAAKSVLPEALESLSSLIPIGLAMI